MGQHRSGPPVWGAALCGALPLLAYARALRAVRIPYSEQRRMRSLLTVALTILLGMTCCSPALAQVQGESAPASERRADAIQVRLPDGALAWYEPAANDSGVYVASATAASGAMGGGTTWAILLFLFGLVGQAMFMGRFALQWIASERSGRSVVPLGFWWLSLAGASILLTYFAIQREPIGLLGQLLGWPIYLRNAYMVVRDRRRGLLSADPAAHPVADPNAEA
jgi:lipid-A-disaccharide synthase-like uncharacterized protein